MMSTQLDILDFYHDSCRKYGQYVSTGQASLMGRKLYQYDVIGPSLEKEGWMDLFQIVYGLTIGRACVSAPMHSQYTESPGVIAIFIVLSGQLNIETSDGKILHSFESGAVGIGCRSCVENLLLNYKSSQDNRLEAVSIDVPVSFFGQLFSDRDLSEIKFFPRDNCLLKMDHLCRHFAVKVADKIMQCNCEKLSDIIYVESLVLELIHKIASHFTQIFQPRCGIHRHRHRHYHQVCEAISILENHYDTRHTIASLSRQVGLNECYLKALFKQQTGQTIAECQRSIRMKKARYFIEFSGCSVMDAAQKVGYNNPGHFSTAFRKEYGVPPSSLKPLLMR